MLKHVHWRSVWGRRYVVGGPDGLEKRVLASGDLPLHLLQLRVQLLYLFFQPTNVTLLLLTWSYSRQTFPLVFRRGLSIGVLRGSRLKVSFLKGPWGRWTAGCAATGSLGGFMGPEAELFTLGNVLHRAVVNFESLIKIYFLKGSKLPWFA